MVSVPAAAPVTVPAVPTVAREVLLLLHAPPAVLSLRAVVAPAHTPAVPVMGSGEGFMVAVVVMVHPVARV
jgi:hypothetical protein